MQAMQSIDLCDGNVTVIVTLRCFACSPLHARRRHHNHVEAKSEEDDLNFFMTLQKWP